MSVWCLLKSIQIKKLKQQPPPPPPPKQPTVIQPIRTPPTKEPTTILSPINGSQPNYQPQNQDFYYDDPPPAPGGGGGARRPTKISQDPKLNRLTQKWTLPDDDDDYNQKESFQEVLKTLKDSESQSKND